MQRLCAYRSTILGPGFIIRVASALIFVGVALTLALAPSANASERLNIIPSFFERETSSSSAEKMNQCRLGADAGAFHITHSDDLCNLATDKGGERQKLHPMPMLIAQRASGTPANEKQYTGDDVMNFARSSFRGNACEIYLMKRGIIHDDNDPKPVGIGGNIYVSGEKTAVVNSGGINSWYKRMGNKIFHAEGLSFKKGKYTTERTLLYVLNSAYDPFVLAFVDNDDQMLTRTNFGRATSGHCYIESVETSRAPIVFTRVADMNKPSDAIGQGFRQGSKKMTALNCYQLWDSHRNLHRVSSDAYNKVKECYDAGLLEKNISAVGNYLQSK